MTTFFVIALVAAVAVGGFFITRVGLLAAIIEVIRDRRER
jgi:hypothetical protein